MYTSSSIIQGSWTARSGVLAMGSAGGPDLHTVPICGREHRFCLRILGEQWRRIVWWRRSLLLCLSLLLLFRCSACPAWTRIIAASLVSFAALLLSSCRCSMDTNSSVSVDHFGCAAAPAARIRDLAAAVWAPGCIGRMTTLLPGFTRYLATPPRAVRQRLREPWGLS